MSFSTGWGARPTSAGSCPDGMPTHPSLAPLADLFRLNTALFRNTLASLDEVDASARPNEHTNSAAFIGGHLVETRAWMGRYLGLDTKAPFGGVLEHAISLDQGLQSQNPDPNNTSTTGKGGNIGLGGDRARSPL